MSENYFTGQFLNINDSSQSKQNKAHQSSTVDLQNSNMHSNQETNQQNIQIKKQNLQQKQQQEKQTFVNAQQITIEKEQVQQQKFVQNNPELANQSKKSGNANYNSKQYSIALDFYRKALKYTDRISQQNRKFCSIIYSNIGLTYTKMNQQESAIQYFQNSLKLNQNYTKARINLAQCYQQTQKIEQAFQQYKKVLQLTPNDQFIRQKVQVLSVKVNQIQQKRKQEVIGGLKNIGNSILGFFGMSLDNFKLEKGPGGGYNISMNK